jgi:hypothetical protein
VDKQWHQLRMKTQTKLLESVLRESKSQIKRTRVKAKKKVCQNRKDGILTLKSYLNKNKKFKNSEWRKNSPILKFNGYLHRRSLKIR